MVHSQKYGLGLVRIKIAPSHPTNVGIMCYSTLLFSGFITSLRTGDGAHPGHPWTWGFCPWWMTWPPLPCSRWLWGAPGLVLRKWAAWMFPFFFLQNDVQMGWVKHQKCWNIHELFFATNFCRFQWPYSLESSLIVLSPWLGYGEPNLRVIFPQLCNFLVSVIYIYQI